MLRLARLQVFPQSFYSKKLYHEAATEGRGLGFGVLLALALMLTVITGATHWSQTRRLISQLPYIVKQLPAAAYGNGQLAVQPRSPYFIYLDSQNPLFLTVDTRYADLGLDALATWMRQNHVAATLTATHLVLPKEENKAPASYKLRYFVWNTSFTPQQWQRLHKAVQGYELWIAGVATFAGYYILLVLSALLWGVLTRFLSMCMGGFLDLPAAIRMASITSIPFWAVTEILAAFGDESLLTRLSTRIAYIILAIRANK